MMDSCLYSINTSFFNNSIGNRNARVKETGCNRFSVYHYKKQCVNCCYTIIYLLLFLFVLIPEQGERIHTFLEAFNVGSLLLSNDAPFRKPAKERPGYDPGLVDFTLVSIELFIKMVIDRANGSILTICEGSIIYPLYTYLIGVPRLSSLARISGLSCRMSSAFTTPDGIGSGTILNS